MPKEVGAWDYVVKLGLGRDGQFGIHQSIAAGAAISHPNVVTILDGDPIASLPFIVMPRAGRKYP